MDEVWKPRHTANKQHDRSYGEGLYGASAATHEKWEFSVWLSASEAREGSPLHRLVLQARQLEYSERVGLLQGRRPTEEDARYAADVMAFVFALVHVAGLVKPWADAIDAELVREYRTANARWERERTDRAFGNASPNSDAIREANDRAHAAVLRGTPPPKLRLPLVEPDIEFLSLPTTPRL